MKNVRVGQSCISKESYKFAQSYSASISNEENQGNILPRKHIIFGVIQKSFYKKYCSVSPESHLLFLDILLVHLRRIKYFCNGSDVVDSCRIDNSVGGCLMISHSHTEMT